MLLSNGESRVRRFIYLLPHSLAAWLNRGLLSPGALHTCCLHHSFPFTPGACFSTHHSLTLLPVRLELPILVLLPFFLFYTHCHYHSFSLGPGATFSVSPSPRASCIHITCLHSCYLLNSHSFSAFTTRFSFFHFVFPFICDASNTRYLHQSMPSITKASITLCPLHVVTPSLVTLWYWWRSLHALFSRCHRHLLILST